MRSVIWMLLVAGVASAAEGAKTMATTKTQAKLALSSAAFKSGERIPKQHTGEGKDSSPPLAWSSVPKSAKSLVMIMDDPDAPPGTWVHWVLYDIPASSSGLPEGLAKKEDVLDGAKHGLCWGVDSFDRVGYYGPLPPPGKPHRYQFKLYALDRLLGLKARTTKAEVVKAMQGHILAEGELMGLYQR